MDSKMDNYEGYIQNLKKCVLLQRLKVEGDLKGPDGSAEQTIFIPNVHTAELHSEAIIAWLTLPALINLSIRRWKAARCPQTIARMLTLSKCTVTYMSYPTSVYYCMPATGLTEALSHLRHLDLVNPENTPSDEDMSADLVRFCFRKLLDDASLYPKLESLCMRHCCSDIGLLTADALLKMVSDLLYARFNTLKRVYIALQIVSDYDHEELMKWT